MSRVSLLSKSCQLVSEWCELVSKLCELVSKSCEIVRVSCEVISKSCAYLLTYLHKYNSNKTSNRYLSFIFSRLKVK